jgi:hypothetical protein
MSQKSLNRFQSVSFAALAAKRSEARLTSAQTDRNNAVVTA